MDKQPAATDKEFLYIPIEHLETSKTNTRRLRKETLAELSESITRHGVIQPLVVRPMPGANRYEVIAGERRLLASKLAGLKVVPAVVQELDDENAMEVQLIENLQREDIHPLDEAEGFKRLQKKGPHNIADIAAMVSRSQQYVYDRLKLLSLVPKAQELFRDSVISLAHAIPLSRIPAASQERAIKSEGALFEHEATLWSPGQSSKESKKPRSPRELQGWIDQHVKFDPKAPIVAELFPKTAQAVDLTEKKKEKIVPITYEHYVQPDARDGQRVFGPRSWKRADGKAGSKSCESSVIAVVVVGPQRGESFRVCMDKKGCTTHYGEEQKEAKRRAKLEAKGEKDKAQVEYELAEKRRQEEDAKRQKSRAEFQTALLPILEAVAEKVKRSPTRVGGLLSKLLLGATDQQLYTQPVVANAVKPSEGLVPAAKSADDLVRHAVYMILRRNAFDWNAYESFPKVAKQFGVDVAAIIKKSATETAK